MIYICSDLHGDLNKIKKAKVKIKKGDTLLILGDFGFLNGNDDIMKKSLLWLSKRNYNICFIDGGIDNRNELLNYSTVPLFNSTANKIRENIFYLPRGNVYTIENKTFFTFGGGENLDYIDHYEDEENFISGRISQDELDYSLKNLKIVDNKVNYVLTHDAPKHIREVCLANTNDINITAIHLALQKIRDEIEFDHWFCGKYHLDKSIPPVYTVVYNRFIIIK